MTRTEYQRILFETAVLMMICDGEINDREIQEMELAFKNSTLFKDLTFDEELTRLMDELNRNKKQVVLSYFSKIETDELSPVQRLQILEIALRIMYADNRIEPNEIRFVKLVKSRLKVMDEIFFRRFGEVEFLPGGHVPEKKSDTAQVFVNSIELPDFGGAMMIHDQGES